MDKVHKLPTSTYIRDTSISLSFKHMHSDRQAECLSLYKNLVQRTDAAASYKAMTNELYEAPSLMWWFPVDLFRCHGDDLHEQSLRNKRREFHGARAKSTTWQTHLLVLRDVGKCRWQLEARGRGRSHRWRRTVPWRRSSLL